MGEKVSVFSELSVILKVMMKIEVIVNKCWSKNWSGNIYLKCEKSGTKCFSKMLYAVIPFVVTINTKYYRAALCCCVWRKCLFWLFNKTIKREKKPVMLGFVPFLTLCFVCEEKPVLPSAVVFAPGCDYVCFEFSPDMC